MKKLFALVQAALIGTTLLLPASVLARDASCYKTFLGIQPWFQYLDVNREEIVEGGESVCRVEWSASAEDNIIKVSVAIVDMLLRIAGIVAFLYLVLSGFRFVTAQGDPGKEKAARTAAFNAVLGVVIAVVSTVILEFVTRSLV